MFWVMLDEPDIGSAQQAVANEAVFIVTYRVTARIFFFSPLVDEATMQDCADLGTSVRPYGRAACCISNTGERMYLKSLEHRRATHRE